ncbi:MAG: polysaccharide deacetylase family protein [Chitinophagaceae bacterium]
MSLTADIGGFKEYKGPRINYSAEKITDDEFLIAPHALLFEKNISPQSISCFTSNIHKAFFKTIGDFPFDIFAASFYLLSRYEEYLPHQKDMYGRYDPQNSLAYKEGFVNQPLINYWLKDLKTKLVKKFPSLATHNAQFSFVPSYDIDIAWSYRNKGMVRSIAGMFRALIKGNWQELKQRISKKEKDPYDAYGWMNQLHEKYKIKPYYFFLVAEKTSKYDKNIPPGNKAMRALIHDHAIRYPIGVHPSWRSGDEPGLLKKEIDSLSAITGNSIKSSRQHYIRFTLPETFRRLIDKGIQFDFSMGYGSINGFRASVASPFFWYDLEKEKQTTLLLFPFCYMEANSFYEQKVSAEQALEEMRNYYTAVKSVNGTFIMIWHNSFLGTDPLFAGWRDVFEKFIKEVTSK